LKDKLNQLETKDSYLQKYKTLDLNNLFNMLLKEEIHRKELIIMFTIIKILASRCKEYQQNIGNCNENISHKEV